MADAGPHTQERRQPMSADRFIKMATAIAATALITACSGGGSGSNGSTGAAGQTGTLSLGLFDAPRWDVAEINLEMTAITVKPTDGAAIRFDLDPSMPIDLLSLTPDNAAMLLDGVTVPAGDYDWIRLEVNAEFDGVVDDSYVVDSTGGIVELRVPSGIVRLVSGFTVTANQETSFMIDWDVRQGLTRPPGQPGFMLRPALRIIDMTEFGTLEGTVATDLITPGTATNGCNDDSATDDPDVGNVVYVFAGLGATPDDIDGLDAMTDPNVDPVATLEVSQNTAGDYTYSAILTPGDYTVAFTCQAGLDDPATDDTLLFSAPVDATVVADQTTTIDF